MNNNTNDSAVKSIKDQLIDKENDKVTGNNTSITCGELISRLLAHWGIKDVFGVISIHNMPILDPMGELGEIRFVPARGEAGALNMADAYARVKGGLCAAFTSTGTAAGNAAGAMVEAISAGTPVLHITGQIELEHLGKNRAYIHEAPAQKDMLSAISKGVFQLLSPDDTINVFKAAAEMAMTAPRGPVSIEIPIDVQAGFTKLPKTLPDLEIPQLGIDEAAMSKLAELLKNSRRPVLLLGGGARDAGEAATILADKGICIVTSTMGRAIVDERHPSSIGAFNCSKEIQELYKSCDLMIAIGTRLRSNETWTYKLELPKPLAVIDINEEADKRCYPNNFFAKGEAKPALEYLVKALENAELNIDADFAKDIAKTREQSQSTLRNGIGVYSELVDALQEYADKGSAWVRDVTISNSMWGNRYLKIADPKAGVHALGGGIGQGLPMGIGAALARPDQGALVLTGDGGLNLCLGEFSTMFEEKPNMVLIIMNDAGYGVIRNIQDDIYGGRKHYSNIFTPDYGKIAEAMNIEHHKVEAIKDFKAALDHAIAQKSPQIIEVDMVKIGHYPAKFAGPPKKTKSTNN